MADIRINALATTATTPASDDYLALDGTAQGTRKILATNIANNVTDVILGTSGPSVKSTLSARAPRQGLVFDGTAGATVSVPAFGTSDFSVAAIVNTDLSVNIEGIVGANGSSGFGLFVFNDGTLAVQYTGISTVGGSTSKITANKNSIVAYTRSGTTGTFYINGVSAGTITDSTNYTTAIGLVGNVAGLNIFKGTVAPLIYNRALSASEVVALYESGAPAGADYNNASNTAVYSTDFSSSTGWNLGGSTTISGGKLNLVSNDFAGAPSSTALVIGKRYRFTITVDSITAGNVSYYNGAAYVSFATSAGTYTVDFTAGGSYSFLTLRSDGGNAVCDTFAFYNTGLLLAPDAAQAGGGLVWYDTSGNAANITLPASGVTWNVPSSQKTASGWTYGGQLVTTVNAGTATDSASFIAKNADLNAYSFYASGASADQKYWAIQTGSAIGDGVLRIRAINDALSSGINALSFTRSGISSITATIGGNLTVSGTGTSSFGGKIRSSAATATGYNQLYDTTGITTGRGAFGITSTGAGLAFGIEASVGGTSFTGMTAYASYFGSTTATPVQFIANNSIAATLTSGGNLLIGTTTDGGQKLQVSGDIAVGSGNPFSNAATKFSFTSSTNYAALALAGGAGTGSQIDIGDGAIRRAIITGEIDSTGNKGKLIFRTNAGSSATSASDALTLDSSQKATFAGTIALTGSSAGQVATWNSSNANGIYHTYLTNGTAIGDIGSAAQAVSGSASDFGITSRAGKLVLGTSSAARLTIDTSGDATFAGTVTLPNNKAIYFKEVGGTAQRFALNSGDVIYIEPDQLHKISIGGAGVTNVGAGGIGVAGNSVFGGSIAIGNTVQTAAAVASTHKVTISIGGVTYYLLATNV